MGLVYSLYMNIFVMCGYRDHMYKLSEKWVRIMVMAGENFLCGFGWKYKRVSSLDTSVLLLFIVIKLNLLPSRSHPSPPPQSKSKSKWSYFLCVPLPPPLLQLCTVTRKLSWAKTHLSLSKTYQWLYNNQTHSLCICPTSERKANKKFGYCD